MPDGEPMITRSDVDKLLSIRAAGAPLLSLCLRVPREWMARRDQRLAIGIVEPPDELATVGLDACIAAVGQHAIDALLARA